MTYRVQIQPEAETDLILAYRWYEARSLGLGSEFLRSIEAGLLAIQRNPEAFSIVHKTVRRSLIRRFPYGIFYVVRAKTIYVLACFHAKRDPRLWQSRSLSH